MENKMIPHPPSPSLRPFTRISGLLLPLLFLATGSTCEGELNGVTPTPIPPPDPHDQSIDEVVYWDAVVPEDGTSSFFAVGGFAENDLYVAGAEGMVWHWNGRELEEYGLLTSEEGVAPQLYGMWTYSDGQGRLVVVVGSEGAIFQDFQDGMGLRRMSSGTRSQFRSVIGFARNDIWAVGDGGVYHFDGNGWSRDTSAPGNSPLSGIWGTSSQSLYAAGDAGLLLRRTLSGEDYRWSPVNLGLGEDLHAVWGTSSGEIFAVGQAGLVLHFDGADWHEQATDSFDHLWGVYGLSDTAVFAAGLNGTTLYYDGLGWQRLGTGLSRNLYGVFGLDRSHVYAVGTWGTLLRYDDDPTPPPYEEETPAARPALDETP